MTNPAIRKADDQHHLQDGRDQLKGAGVPDAGELHERHQPDHADRQRQRRRARQHRLAIFAERHRGQRHRRGETDRRRHPAGQKSERRMKGAAQEIIFAARARKHRAEFAVGKHPAQRDDAADGPQQQDRKARRDVLDLKAEAGEDADADHVGDDDGGRHDRPRPWTRRREAGRAMPRFPFLMPPCRSTPRASRPDLSIVQADPRQFKQR